MKITKDWLIAQQACEHGVVQFDKLFPCGCDVTLENCITAAVNGLGLHWVAYHVFPNDVYKQLANETEDARMKNARDCLPFQDEFELVTCQAWRDFYRAEEDVVLLAPRGSSLYNERMAPATAAWHAAVDPARSEMQAKCAPFERELGYKMARAFYTHFVTIKEMYEA